MPIDFEKLLKKTGLSMGDLDCYEINEAFATVPLANIKLLELDVDRVNVQKDGKGGAVGLGYHIGVTGAYFFVNLLNILRHKHATIVVVEPPP